MNLDHDCEKQVFDKIKCTVSRLRRLRELKVKDKKDCIKEEILTLIKNVSITLKVLLNYVFFCLKQ